MGKRRGFLSRALEKLPYLLMAAPVVVAALYVRQYGVNAPYNDGLTLIPLFEKLLAGELRFEDLAAQHNEHRIFFPRIAMLLIGLATSFNDVAVMYSVLACLLVTAAALLLAFRRTVSRSPWLFLPVPFLVFSLGQSWNMLQGFQITLVFVQTFTVLAFVLLHLSGGDPRGALAFCGALAAGTVAAFSSAPGLLVWPLGVLQILLLRAGMKNKLIMAAVWAGMWAVQWTLYLRGYESSRTTTWRDSLRNPAESLEYLASALGASLFHGRQDLAFACGVLLLFLSAAAVILAYGSRGFSGLSVWAPLLGFTALTLAATTLARGSTLEDALNPKYVTYSVLAPIAVYAMLASSLGGGRWTLRRDPASYLPAAALAVVFAVSLSLSYPQDVSEARDIAQNKQRTAFVLATYESQPDEALASRGVLRERFRVEPETSRQQAKFLERSGYSIFSEPRPEVLPPPLPDPSPGPADAPADSGITGDVETALMRRGDDTFLKVSGWSAEAGEGEPVRGVYVLVDGRPYPAFYGESSRDARRSGVAENVRAGFERSIPVSELGSGEHELSVVVVTKTGESYLDAGQDSRRMSFEL